MGTTAVDERKRELRRHFRQVRKDLGEQGRAEVDAGIEAQLKALP